MRKKITIYVFVVAITIAITKLWCDFFQEHVYLSACDPKEKVIAKLIWKMTSPTLLDSFLIVEDFKGNRLLLKRLQEGRDHQMDVYMAYQGIDVSNRTVSIQTSTGSQDFGYSPYSRSK